MYKVTRQTLSDESALHRRKLVLLPDGACDAPMLTLELPCSVDMDTLLAPPGPLNSSA